MIDVKTKPLSRRGARSARRPRHRSPAQQVQMEVKHRLAAVGVGVHDDAVAPLGQLGVTRQVAREGEQATEQLWIPRIVERSEVISRNNESEGWCHVLAYVQRIITRIPPP